MLIPKRKTITNNQERIAGIYVLSNPAWPEWLKLGKSSNLLQRTGDYNTGSPHRDYKVELMVKSIQCLGLEMFMQDNLSLKYERKREWFKCSIQDIIDLLKCREDLEILYLN